MRIGPGIGLGIAAKITPTSPPTVSSTFPDVGTAAGGTAITITGANFTGATGVTLNGAAATAVVVVNSSTITCTSAAGTAAAGTSVVVTTPAGSNAGNALWNYLPSGYIQHLRADLGVTPNGATASAWADQSVSANNLQQPTAGKQPTVVAAGGSGINGQADMTYAGGQYLYGTATDLVTTAFTAFCVLKTATLAAGDQPYGKAYGAIEWYFAGAGSGKLRAGVNGANFAVSNAAVNDGVARYFAAVWDKNVNAGLLTLYQNGVAQTTTAASVATIAGTDTNGVGAEINPSPATFAAGYTGQMPEVLLYPTALSPTNRAIVETYLHNRYNI